MQDPGPVYTSFLLARLIKASEIDVDTLVAKLGRALEQNADCKDVYVAGGVACNSLLREKIAQVGATRGKTVHFPSARFCTDNGAMIAYLGNLLAQRGFYHTPDFESIPRGSRIPADMRQTGCYACQQI